MSNSPLRSLSVGIPFAVMQGQTAFEAVTCVGYSCLSLIAIRCMEASQEATLGTIGSDQFIYHRRSRRRSRRRSQMVVIGAIVFHVIVTISSLILHPPACCQPDGAERSSLCVAVCSPIFHRYFSVPLYSSSLGMSPQIYMCIRILRNYSVPSHT